MNVEEKKENKCTYCTIDTFSEQIMSKNINYRGKGPYLNIDSCSKIRLAYYQWTFLSV